MSAPDAKIEQVQQPNAPSVSSDVAEKGSLGTSAASARKNSGDNRHDVIPSSTTSAAGKARQSPVSLSAALRQPLARPGDIGFRSGVGVRMRPHSPSRLKPRNPGTIKPYKSTTIDRIGESVKGGGSGRGQRVTKLTAAAAAKVASNADPPAWAGRLRSASSAANSRSGNARPSTRGVWAGGKPSVDEAERKGGEDKAAAAAIMAKLSRKGMIKGKGRGGGCPGSDAGGADNVESLQEQARRGFRLSTNFGQGRRWEGVVKGREKKHCGFALNVSRHCVIVFEGSLCVEAVHMQEIEVMS